MVELSRKNMANIIKIAGEIISIGTDDGKIREVRTSDLNFNPSVGDEVEVFENDDSIIISKKKSTSEEKVNSGININVNSSPNTGQSVYVANNMQSVDKVVYCLLALIAFIEFIVALCKPADADGNILI